MSHESRLAKLEQAADIRDSWQPTDTYKTWFQRTTGREYSSDNLNAAIEEQLERILGKNPDPREEAELVRDVFRNLRLAGYRTPHNPPIPFEPGIEEDSANQF